MKSLAQGYDAVKARVHPLHPLPRAAAGGRQGRPDDGSAARRGRARGRHHGRFPRAAGSAAAALDYIDALAPGRPMFVEEPLPPGETEGLSRRGSFEGADRVRRAAGRPPRIRRSLAARVFNIAQPDICHTGGLLEAKKIAAMAETSRSGSRRTIRSGRSPASPRCISAFRRPTSSSRRRWSGRSPGTTRWSSGRSSASTAAGTSRSAGTRRHRQRGGIARHPFKQEVLQPATPCWPTAPWSTGDRHGGSARGQRSPSSPAPARASARRSPGPSPAKARP